MFISAFYYIKPVSGRIAKFAFKDDAYYVLFFFAFIHGHIFLYFSANIFEILQIVSTGITLSYFSFVSVVVCAINVCCVFK